MSYKERSKRELVNFFITPGPTVDRPALPATGRAGRNLPAATAVGVLLSAVVVIGIVWVPPLFSALIVVAVVIACRELAGALARQDIQVALLPLWLGGILTVFSPYLASLAAAGITTFLTITTGALWCLLRRRADTDRHRAIFHDIAATALIALYVPLLGAFAVAILVNQPTPLPMLAYILAVVGNDLGGWLAGVNFGKHPMAPTISPKKSWEGFAGSVAMATTTSVLMFWAMGGALWWGLVMGILMATAATVGDLGESLFKRDVGLKDMGWILPGHGGAMDRLDSILMCAPVAYMIYWMAFGWLR